jgi:signal transduction histidine kinase
VTADGDQGWFSRLDLRRRMALLLVVGTIAVGSALGVLVYSIVQLHDRRSAVTDRLDPSSLAVADLRAALVDQETGVRGYVLSQDPAFLEPYFAGLEEADDAMDELDRLLGDGTLAQSDLDEVRASVQAWRTDYAERVVGRVSGSGPTVNEQFLDQSRAAFDELRGSLARLDGLIGEEVAAARSAADDAYRQVLVLSVVVAAWLVVLAVAGMVGLRRSVTAPVEELADQVRTVASGELRRPVVGNGPPELVGLGADIDAMRHRILDDLDDLEHARAAIAQQALELERSNADLEQFAYVASHDLQEPLRKIAGFCQLLERRYRGQLDERADQYIEFVVDGAKRMQDLINDLLAFSRVGRTTERFVPVELGSAVASALADLGTVPDDAGATIDVGPLPTVEGDPRLLAALFQNLLGNSVKFRADDPPHVVVRAHPVDGTATRITVSDNGIGISEEYAEQIFTLFQRLHNRSRYEGTGIGLALCKKIVEFHGGTIELDTSTPAPGATFVVTLPLHARLPESVVPEAGQSPDATSPPGAGNPDATIRPVTPHTDPIQEQPQP